MIYIVIPVFNRKTFTKNCLDSLNRQSYNNFKIVVVDDGSTDGTSEMLTENYPEVILLKGTGNLFWTASTNLGVKYALEHHASYILTLNNDTIAFEDFLEKMVSWAEKEPQALIGAMAVNERTKQPDYIGEIINWKFASYKSLPKLNDTEYTGLHEVTHFPGRGLLIPREVFENIGMYDGKHFPQYSADYDFTHMASRAGYKIFCNYDARIYVYPEESGSEQIRNNKSLKSFYNHLFGLKSASNIKIFTRYAMKNCPRRYLLSFLVIGLIKRIGGYLRDWALNNNNYRSALIANKQNG